MRQISQQARLLLSRMDAPGANVAWVRNAGKFAMSVAGELGDVVRDSTLTVLAERGLVRRTPHPDPPVYEITSKGRQYIAHRIGGSSKPLPSSIEVASEGLAHE